MTLSPAFLDELRARTLLSGVIAPSVKLIKAGREFKACCPFHQEKTPSFTVNDEKGFYHCLAGETVVITRRGRAAIVDLAGHTADVLGPSGHWIAAPFASFGKQRLWEIALSRNGVRKSLFATSHHRWFARKRKSEVLTIDLKPGARLTSAAPEPRVQWELDATGVRHGIIFGDGTMYGGTYGTLTLHGSANMALARWFPDQSHQTKFRDENKPYLRIYGGRAFAGFKSLPDKQASDAYLLGFLAGYFAADGHVAKDGTVMLHSSRCEHLDAVRDIASALGIVTYGLTTQNRLGIDGKFSNLHRIHFAASSLAPDFFLMEEARKRCVENSKAFDRLRWAVRSVVPTDRTETVYCAEVPDDHAFALDDNILTGNCFGCGAHGDAIRFLTDQRGLPFIDAVKELAGKAGMEVPASDPRSKERSDAAAGLYDVMAAAQRWFAEQLQGAEGGAARDYLAKRGINPLTVERFGLGLAPNARTRLKAALASHGEDKLVETGMLIKPDDPGSGSGTGAGETYDRFRGRLMIPIRDARGRVIAFGGRILGDGEPKYLNSPETPLFDKGRTLYNIDRASPASRSAKRLIVVEGYMDVIGLDSAGIAEVVAPNGTAVTEAQLERMWRLDPAPLLCFDGDAAGQKAAIRAALRALPYVGPDRTLRFVTMPAGEDPDDVVKKGGRAAFEALIDAAEPLVEHLWRHERDAAPLATPEERASLKARLLAHAGTISDNSVRSLYRDEWLARFDALFARTQPQRREWKPGKWKPGQRGGYVPAPAPMGQVARAIGKGGIDRATARAVIAGFAYFPEAIAANAETLAVLPIADPLAARLRDHMVDAALTGAELDRAGLATILESAGAEAALKDVRRSGGIGFSFTRSDTDPERAMRDLTVAIEALAAEGEIEAALAEATTRLQAGDASAFDEQLRLHAARDEATQRLASLATSD